MSIEDLKESYVRDNFQLILHNVLEELKNNTIWDINYHNFYKDVPKEPKYLTPTDVTKVDRLLLVQTIETIGMRYNYEVHSYQDTAALAKILLILPFMGLNIESYREFTAQKDLSQLNSTSSTETDNLLAYQISLSNIKLSAEDTKEKEVDSWLRERLEAIDKDLMRNIQNACSANHGKVWHDLRTQMNWCISRSMEYTGCESEVTQALYHCLIYPLTKLFNIVYNMTLKASYGILLEDTMIPEFPKFDKTKPGSTVFSDVNGKRGVHLVLEAEKPFLSQLFNSKERGFNRQYRDFYGKLLSYLTISQTVRKGLLTDGVSMRFTHFNEIDIVNGNLTSAQDNGSSTNNSNGFIDEKSKTIKMSEFYSQDASPEERVTAAKIIMCILYDSCFTDLINGPSSTLKNIYEYLSTIQKKEHGRCKFGEIIQEYTFYTPVEVCKMSAADYFRKFKPKYPVENPEIQSQRDEKSLQDGNVILKLYDEEKIEKFFKEKGMDKYYTSTNEDGGSPLFDEARYNSDFGAFKEGVLNMYLDEVEAYTRIQNFNKTCSDPNDKINSPYLIRCAKIKHPSSGRFIYYLVISEISFVDRKPHTFEELCPSVFKQLDRLHSIGIIHRDIKRSNICFDEQTELIWIFDFNHCLLFDPEQETVPNIVCKDLNDLDNYVIPISED